MKEGVLRILIAIRNSGLRSALKSLIKRNNNKDEVIETNNPADFFKKLSSNDYDLLLLNWLFFDKRSEEIIKILKDDYPKTIVVCMDISKKNKNDALQANADAFYLECDPPGDLLKLVEGYRSDN